MSVACVFCFTILVFLWTWLCRVFAIKILMLWNVTDLHNVPLASQKQVYLAISNADNSSFLPLLFRWSEPHKCQQIKHRSSVSESAGLCSKVRAGEVLCRVPKIGWRLCMGSETGRSPCKQAWCHPNRWAEAQAAKQSFRNTKRICWRHISKHEMSERVKPPNLKGRICASSVGWANAENKHFCLGSFPGATERFFHCCETQRDWVGEESCKTVLLPYHMDHFPQTVLTR